MGGKEPVKHVLTYYHDSKLDSLDLISASCSEWHVVEVDWVEGVKCRYGTRIRKLYKLCTLRHLIEYRLSSDVTETALFINF